jgi:outer membrane biosynthesis protein TonB
MASWKGSPHGASVRQARGRISAFNGQLGQIEHRRHAVVEQIKEGAEVLDILEEDLFDLKLEEEQRKREWIPEREISELPARPAIMPWTRSGEDDRRFRRALWASLAYALLLGLIVPQIDLPLSDLVSVPEVPDRLARLIQEQELPPPPPPVEEPKPEEAEPEPEPEPAVAEQPPTQVPEEKEAPAPAQEPAPQRQVRSAGILAFKDSLAKLADNKPAARLGSQARINNAGASAVGRPERSMVTTQAPGSSGGINLGSLSRDVGGSGGDGLTEGVRIARVASSIGTSGTSDRPMSGGASAGRTDEEIQIVFDRYKAALYRLYNRELRNNPTLQGQIVLQLTIEPNGSVSSCVVQSSDMNAPALERQVANRVLAFDFGAKDVSAITILYPIDFLPAA